MVPEKVLIAIFGSKGTEVKEGWTKFYSVELQNLFYSPNFIR
jgi:hypothetical protein